MNKKHFLIWLAAVYGAAATNCPAQAQRHLSIGFKAGTNFSDLRYAKKYREAFKMELGWEYVRCTPTVGVTANQDLTKFLRLRTELLYEDRGRNAPHGPVIVETPTGGNYAESGFHYYYKFLTLPVLAELHTNGQHWRLATHAGFAVSYRLKSGVEGAKGTIPIQNLMPWVKRPLFDASWAVGAGLEHSLNKDYQLALEARYYQSMTPIGRWSIENYLRMRGVILTLGASVRLD